MTRESIIDTIRKCLALTTSNHPGEAANAAAMVQKLLFKHKLTMADITPKEERSPIENQDQFINARKHEGKWRANLINTLARYNFCKVILCGKNLVFIIGDKDSVDTVKELYPWVEEQLEREEPIAWSEISTIGQALEEPIKRKSFRRSFFTGAVVEIGNRLYRQWEELRQQTEASTALVVYNEQAIADYVEQHFGQLRKGRHSGSYGSGYMSGRAAGARVNLNRPAKQLEGA